MHEESELVTLVGTYIEDEIGDYLLGDIIQVKEITPEMEATLNAEDYYYLLGFSKKKGTITDIKKGEKLNIYVDFGGTIGVFYEHDIKKII